MTDEAEPESSFSPAGPFKLDLRVEARRLFRQRIGVVAIGIVLGLAFIGVGAYEAGVFVSGGPSPSYAIALLLIVLGGALAFWSWYSGMTNPVTVLRGNASGITFERRWGGPFTWKWTDTDFRLNIDDRTADPTADEEARERLFFEGPPTIYGSLTPASLGPLLDTARMYGGVVSEKILEQRDRRGVHRVRRIRVRPAPLR